MLKTLKMKANLCIFLSSMFGNLVVRFNMGRLHKIQEHQLLMYLLYFAICIAFSSNFFSIHIITNYLLLSGNENLFLITPSISSFRSNVTFDIAITFQLYICSQSPKKTNKTVKIKNKRKYLWSVNMSNFWLSNPRTL